MAAPRDKSRPSSSINWFVRQLREARDIDPIIRVYWPRSSHPSGCKLSELQEQSTSILIPEARKKTLPASFEVAWVIDLGSRYKGTGMYVDDVTGALPRFYEAVSERLKVYVPKKNKPVQSKSVDSGQKDLVFDAETEVEPKVAKEPPREVFRIDPTRERRYLNERYN